MQFQQNYPLSQITTLGIGGPVKKFVKVSSSEELIAAIQYAKEDSLEYIVIGGGSNLLIADEGVDKLIIKNNIVGITTSKVDPDSFEVKVKSGTVLQNLVDYSISKGLAGLQKMTGIPGTLGGAVFGNAGAYGQTISDHITIVAAYDGNQIITLSKDQCEFNYRDSGFKRNQYTILEVTFQLEKDDPKTLQQEADEVLEKRLVKYPPGIKCPGSFFKNIVADTLPREILEKIPQEKIIFGKLPAGFLLEQVGAKGQKLGDIEIADYHGNLFINRGGGNAQDFYNLAKEMSQKVQEKFGITLEPEVQLINLPPL